MKPHKFKIGDIVRYKLTDFSAHDYLRHAGFGVIDEIQPVLVRIIPIGCEMCNGGPHPGHWWVYHQDVKIAKLP